MLVPCMGAVHKKTACLHLVPAPPGSRTGARLARSARAPEQLLVDVLRVEGVVLPVGQAVQSGKGAEALPPIEKVPTAHSGQLGPPPYQDAHTVRWQSIGMSQEGSRSDVFRATKRRCIPVPFTTCSLACRASIA